MIDGTVAGGIFERVEPDGNTGWHAWRAGSEREIPSRRFLPAAAAVEVLMDELALDSQSNPVARGRHGSAALARCRPGPCADDDLVTRAFLLSVQADLNWAFLLGLLSGFVVTGAAAVFLA